MADPDDFGVDHACRHSKSFGRLLFDAKTSDLTIRVGGESIPAHRAILASSCDYLNALLYGEMAEGDLDEIVLEEVPLDAFKLIMRYIYTGILEMPKEHIPNEILTVLSLAHLYGFEELQSALNRYLGRMLTAQNAVLIFKEAPRFQSTDLEKYIGEFIDENFEEIVRSDSYLQLSSATLQEILSRDTLCAKEIEIFKAVERWISRQLDKEGWSSIFEKIRLQFISVLDLTNTVMDSGLISSDRLLGAIKEKMKCDIVSTEYRIHVQEEENIATSGRGTEVLMAPFQRRKFFSGLNLPVGTWTDSPWRKLFIDGRVGIVFRFGKPHMINKILIDLDNPSWYSIEVSLNGKDWRKVVDYSMYQCHSDQELFFEPQVVRYVRVSETSLFITSTNWLSIKNFEACFTRKPLEVNDGIVIPVGNVSSPNMGARIHGVKGSLENAFIVGTSQRDPGRKVFSAVLRDFPLVIKLKQPYLVGSLRTLLWDGVPRACSYSVDVSANTIKWSRVATFLRSPNNQWQFMQFKPSAVMFMKIDSDERSTQRRFVNIECPFVGCDHMPFQLDRLP